MSTLRINFAYRCNNIKQDAKVPIVAWNFFYVGDES